MRSSNKPLLTHLISALQVVAAAAQTLCALAKLSNTAKERLSLLYQRHMTWLEATSTKLLSPGAPPEQLQSSVALTCRYAFVCCVVLCHATSTEVTAEYTCAAMAVDRLLQAACLQQKQQ